MDEDGLPLEWSVTFQQPNEGARYTGIVDSQFFNGAPALRLGGSEESGRAIAVQRDIPGDGVAGKTVKLSAWYKGEDVVKHDGSPHTPENFVRVEFYERDGDGLKSTGGSRSVAGPTGTTDGWIDVSGEFEVPDGTEIMWISISLRHASGAAAWASIELVEVEN